MAMLQQHSIPEDAEFFQQRADAGHVRVYHLDDSGSSSSWVKVGNDIDGVAAEDESGFSVSLSADGKSVAIGSPGNDGNGANAGHVRVFSVLSSSPITSPASKAPSAQSSASPSLSPITSQPSYPSSQNVSYWYKIFICFI